MRRPKLTRVLWWAEWYAEGHKSALMATWASLGPPGRLRWLLENPEDHQSAVVKRGMLMNTREAVMAS